MTGIKQLKQFLKKETHIVPLAVFRMVFGAIMFLSIFRFLLNGWVQDLYIDPLYFFPYYGFEWVQPLPGKLMYIPFIIMLISFLFQSLGLFYRLSSILSFVSFTYVELIDKSNYLNHYYFVSIVCLLLIFVPAHRYCSLDVKRKPQLKRTHIPRLFILLFQLQLSIVYFYAGLAKLNTDWLVEALPLKIWLPAKANLPMIGAWLSEEWLAYAFSWGGAIYDLSIPFLLFYHRTRPVSYFLVIVFHGLTYLLFQIGMFPFIMMGATLIFFSEKFHLKITDRLTKREESNKKTSLVVQGWKPIGLLLSVFFFLQLAIPFRYLLYPDNLYWTEEGYRFSWRVMLMEKAAYAIFHVRDQKNNKRWEVNNYDFLTANQEKMMSTQADMILQYAHFLNKHYEAQGMEKLVITAEVYASLNGRPSQLLIDTTVDLTKIKEGFQHKNWIVPLNQ